jgi:hypothetical protein
MTKQQLREAIRRIIKSELNEGLFMPPMQVAYIEGYKDGKSGKPMNMEYGKDLEEGTKSVSNPNAGKWRIVTSDKEKPLTDKFYDSKAEAEEASRKIGKINAPGIKIIQLKDTMKVFAKENKPAQAPSKPATTPGIKEKPATPDKKEPRRPLGNPNVQPAPKAKATMKEAEMLKQVIKRFKSKK